MKNRILLILVFSLMVSTSCRTAKNAYTLDEMLYMGSFMPNYATKYGFFIHSDTTKAVLIPRGRRGTIKNYERICNHFIYIP